MIDYLYKLNANIKNIVRDLNELNKGFTKEDHEVIIGESNFCRSERLHIITKNSKHTNVNLPCHGRLAIVLTADSHVLLSVI